MLIFGYNNIKNILFWRTLRIHWPAAEEKKNPINSKVNSGIPWDRFGWIRRGSSNVIDVRFINPVWSD